MKKVEQITKLKGFTRTLNKFNFVKKPDGTVALLAYQNVLPVEIYFDYPIINSDAEYMTASQSTRVASPITLTTCMKQK